MTNRPHPRRRKPARSRKPFVRFFKRHAQAEETIAEAVGIDLLWVAVRYLMFGAAVASAAVLVSSAAKTYHPNFSLSTKGAAFVTRNEGVRYVPYNDPWNCTVGVGHLIHYRKCSSYDYTHWKITAAQSLALLMRDSAGAGSCVNGRITRPINQPQFDALVDLAFNAGCGSLDYSGIANEINTGNLTSVPATLSHTAVTANGVYLAGLRTRRLAEGELFAHSYYGTGIGYYLPPKPPTAADLLRAKTGYWPWLAWYLGAKPWHKYGPRNAKVRPHVPAKIPAAWWGRERAFVKVRA